MKHYFKATNSIFDKETDLTTADKLIFLYLCRITNNKNEGWSSYTTIAKKCVVKRITAIRPIKRLIDYGLITLQHNGKANHYKVTGIRKIPV